MEDRIAFSTGSIASARIQITLAAPDRGSTNAALRGVIYLEAGRGPPAAFDERHTTTPAESGAGTVAHKRHRHSETSARA